MWKPQQGADDDTPHNLWQAARWYPPAAERGDAQARYNICGLLFNGDGALRDLGEARKWCAKAAAQGEREAQRLLRRIEDSGWFALAAAEDGPSDVVGWIQVHRRATASVLFSCPVRRDLALPLSDLCPDRSQSS